MSIAAPASVSNAACRSRNNIPLDDFKVDPSISTTIGTQPANNGLSLLVHTDEKKEDEKESEEGVDDEEEEEEEEDKDEKSEFTQQLLSSHACIGGGIDWLHTTAG